MQNTFKAISISYKNAPLEVRESVAFDEQGCKNLLELFRSYLSVKEIMVLSTCNRLEIYYHSESELSLAILKLIAVQKGINHKSFQNYVKVMDDQTEAITHLFHVSTGLESQVVGDLQISNQVKKAYQLSADAGLAQAFLHRLMHTVFAANKRIVQETNFRDGAASVSYAAVELVKELTENVVNPEILVVGLGEIGTDVCKTLQKSGIGRLKIANRTYMKAVGLAKIQDCEVVEWRNIGEAIKEADVVISCVPGQQDFFLNSKLTATGKPKIFIDLSVPRSIEPNIEEIPGFLLFNIDHIRNRTEEVLAIRKAAIPSVKHIINESIQGFLLWLQEIQVSPVIHQFKEALEKIKREEINRVVKNLSLEEQIKVEEITGNIVQKILKLPVVHLKSACKRGESEIISGILKELFNLDDQKSPSGV